MKEKSADVIEKPTGVLLYSLASSNVKEDWQIKLVTEYIADKKLASSIQLTGKVRAPWSKVFEGLNWDISCSVSVPSKCHPTISTCMFHHLPLSLFLALFSSSSSLAVFSFFPLSFFPFFFLLIHLSVRQSVGQLISLSIYPFVCLSNHPSVWSSVSQSVNQSVSQTDKQTVSQSIM